MRDPSVLLRSGLLRAEIDSIGISPRVAVLKQYFALVLDCGEELGETSMLPSHFLRCASAGTTLAVRAQPGARKTAITGIYGEGATAQLKIAVHAPRNRGPRRSRRRSADCFPGQHLGLPKKPPSQLISGQSASKVFLYLRGVASMDQAQRELARHSSLDKYKKTRVAPCEEFSALQTAEMKGQTKE